MGLRDWRTGREAGRQQQAVLLFQLRAESAHLQQGRSHPVPRADAAERKGDFSQSRDNNGNLYPYIKNPSQTGACNAASQVACFADGGVLGRIPSSALYGPGLNVLKWWPEPNLPDTQGVAYNYETRYPGAELVRLSAHRPDRLPADARTLRGSFKFFEYQQPNEPILGTIPGFNDSRQDDYGIWAPSATVNWTINSDDVRRRRPGARTSTTRRAARSSAARRRSAARTATRSIPRQIALPRASAISRTSFPTARSSSPARRRMRSPNASSRPIGTAPASSRRSSSPSARASRTRRRTTSALS